MTRLTGFLQVQSLVALLLINAQPPSERASHTEQRSSSIVVTASVRSETKPINPDGTPAVTAGSGAVLIDDRLYIVQDDSNFLAVLLPGKRFEALRLFPAVAGKDRFLDTLGNKKSKADVEVLFALPSGLFTEVAKTASNQILVAMGSGSIPGARDRIALIFPAPNVQDSRVVQIEARSLYKALRAEPRLIGERGQLNLEGAVALGSGSVVRLYQRSTAAGGAVASLAVSSRDLARYLIAASKNPDAPLSATLSDFKTHDLGTSANGSPVAITDATVFHFDSSELVLVAGVAEDTTDVTADGAVSESTIGFGTDSGSFAIAPLTYGGKKYSSKVEGLAIRSVEKNRGSLRLSVVAVVDPDATTADTPSSILEIDVLVSGY